MPEQIVQRRMFHHTKQANSYWCYLYEFAQTTDTIIYRTHPIAVAGGVANSSASFGLVLYPLGSDRACPTRTPRRYFPRHWYLACRPPQHRLALGIGRLQALSTLMGRLSIPNPSGSGALGPTRATPIISPTPPPLLVAGGTASPHTTKTTRYPRTRFALTTSKLMESFRTIAGQPSRDLLIVSPRRTRSWHQTVKPH